MLYAKHMRDTAAVTEHKAESASASERRLAADGAAATEHGEESANAFERHTTAQSLPMHRWHCHGAAKETSLREGCQTLIKSNGGRNDNKENGKQSSEYTKAHSWRSKETAPAKEKLRTCLLQSNRFSKSLT